MLRKNDFVVQNHFPVKTKGGVRMKLVCGSLSFSSPPPFFFIVSGPCCSGTFLALMLFIRITGCSPPPFPLFLVSEYLPCFLPPLLTFKVINKKKKKIKQQHQNIIKQNSK
eukprot:TRINITY_DN1495_c0_g2_i1.p3 TRINITY_DN1495_c0_g2~~TRINITY_DN1495_c0_g2_i1.p3  ORF type:complete len:111 (+),score=7.93 TRINITY_DN1495_c0_g2_i1:657-989(+)